MATNNFMATNNTGTNNNFTEVLTQVSLIIPHLSPTTSIYNFKGHLLIETSSQPKINLTVYPILNVDTIKEGLVAVISSDNLHDEFIKITTDELIDYLTTYVPIHVSYKLDVSSPYVTIW